MKKRIHVNQHNIKFNRMLAKQLELYPDDPTEPKPVLTVSAPEPVALAALEAIGKGPVLVPTLADRMSAGLLSKLLPRSWTLSLMKRSIEKMRE